MDFEHSVIYGLEYQARALAPYSPETEKIQFLVATQGLRSQNQIHLLTLEEDNDNIKKNIINFYEGEIWNISSPSYQHNIISTVYNYVSEGRVEMQAKIFKFFINDENIDDNQSSELTEILKIDSENKEIKSLFWYPSNEKCDFVVLAGNNLLLYDLNNNNNARLISKGTLDNNNNYNNNNNNMNNNNNNNNFTTGCWDPHHNCVSIATANDNHFKLWDVRTMSPSLKLDSCHSNTIRCINYNPNKQYIVATCSDDCTAKFWDLRNGNIPIKTIYNHSHWVWCVKYNNYHDQLVLTSSSDGTVLLHNLPSISSEPYGNLLEDEDEEEEEDDGVEKQEEEKEEENEKTESKEKITEENKQERKRKKSEKNNSKDQVIMNYDEFEDSVYCCDWSTADPWTFASLSYDGRVVFNRVPRDIKYSILL